eukprot:Platyproteum_vivax@DN3114_c0_g1_i1.p1
MVSMASQVIATIVATYIQANKGLFRRVDEDDHLNDLRKLIKSVTVLLSVGVDSQSVGACHLMQFATQELNQKSCNALCEFPKLADAFFNFAVHLLPPPNKAPPKLPLSETVLQSVVAMSLTATNHRDERVQKLALTVISHVAQTVLHAYKSNAQLSSLEPKTTTPKL